MINMRAFGALQLAIFFYGSLLPQLVQQLIYHKHYLVIFSTNTILQQVHNHILPPLPKPFDSPLPSFFNLTLKLYY